jgi:hypothetical protein
LNGTQVRRITSKEEEQKQEEQYHQKTMRRGKLMEEVLSEVVIRWTPPSSLPPLGPDSLGANYVIKSYKVMLSKNGGRYGYIEGTKICDDLEATIEEPQYAKLSSSLYGRCLPM